MAHFSSFLRVNKTLKHQKRLRIFFSASRNPPGLCLHFFIQLHCDNEFKHSDCAVFKFCSARRRVYKRRLENVYTSGPPLDWTCSTQRIGQTASRQIRDLVQDPRQPRTHTRETDEDDAEAHEYFHFHQTRGRGGRHRTRQG